MRLGAFFNILMVNLNKGVHVAAPAHLLQLSETFPNMALAADPKELLCHWLLSESLR